MTFVKIFSVVWGETMWNWNNELLNQLESKAKLDLKSASREEKEIILENLKQILYLKRIMGLKPSFSFSKESYLDKNRILKKESYEDFQRIPYWVKEVILKSTPIFENVNIVPQPVSTYNWKEKEILDTTYQFAKWLHDPNYLKFFEKYFISNHSFLKQTKDSNNMGETFSLYYKNHYYPFILIQKGSTTELLHTLQHELFHSYFFRYDKNTQKNQDDWYLKETEGYAGDALMTRFYAPDSQAIYHNLIADGCDNFYDFLLFYIVCKTYQKKKNFSSIDIEQSLLERNLELETKDLYSSLFLNHPMEIAKYFISFLIFLDLMEEKDPTKIMFYLNNIRKTKDVSVYHLLEQNGVHFFEDHYQNLKKALQKETM